MLRQVMRWGIALAGFIKRMKEDHVGAYAAQSAYFFLMSCIPLLLLIMTLIRYLPITEYDFVVMMMRVVPEEFQNLVYMVVAEVFSKSGAVVPISALFTAWTAAKGIQSLYNGLNTVYHVPVVPNYLTARLISALYTIVFVAAIAITLILMVFGSSIQHGLAAHYPLAADLTAAIVHMRVLITLSFLVFTFLVLYKFVPNRRATWKSQFPGAALSAAAWLVFSFGFSLYVQLSNSFSNMYGSLTTLILVMLWLYICMYILLIGAEINAYFEDRFRRMRVEVLMNRKSGQEMDPTESQ